jgi:predicted exporter
LHANSASATPDLDVARIAAAVSSARLANTQVLDLKIQTDALYASYLEEALRLSGIGLLLIIVLLGFVLRSVRRVAQVLAPLLLAVLAVAAGLALWGVRLNILHLVGMLLIFAVGSNYALFFDRAQITPGDAHPPRLLASLGVANLSTVIGFGLLAFSAVPVLQALGATVAPGAFLALLFAGLLCRPSPRRNA